MFELKEHTNNLISIRVSNINQFFYNNLSKFSSNAGNHIYMGLSNREYNYEALPFKGLMIRKYSDERFLFKLEDSYSQIINDIVLGFNEFQFWDVLISRKIYSTIENDLHFNLKANEMANLYNGFVFYKGIESDVIWIAKSEILHYPFFEQGVW